MDVRYLRSFDESLTKRPLPVQRQVDKAVFQLIEYFQTGQRPHGLGLKRLRGDHWEIRVGLGNRIMLHLTGDWLTFEFVGNHDEIRRFLRHL